MYLLGIKKTMVLAAIGLTLSSCEKTPANFDDCVIKNMEGVRSDVAAVSIRRSCENKFPAPANFFDQFDGQQ